MKIIIQTYKGMVVSVHMGGQTVANVKYEPDEQREIDLPVNIARFVFYACSDRITTTGYIDCLAIV